MSLYTIKVNVKNGLTMLFIVTYQEPNIYFLFKRPNIMCVSTLLSPMVPTNIVLVFCSR